MHKDHKHSGLASFVHTLAVSISTEPVLSHRTTYLQMIWPPKASSSSGAASGTWNRLCFVNIWCARWILSRSAPLSDGLHQLYDPIMLTWDSNNRVDVIDASRCTESTQTYQRRKPTHPLAAHKP